MPAAPRTAASVQKLMPTLSSRSAERFGCAPSASAIWMIRRQSRRAAARTSDAPYAANSRILARQRLEDRARPRAAAPSPVSSADRPPLHLQLAAIRDSCSVRARRSMIDACSEPVPIIGCGGRDCSSRSSSSRRCSTRPMRMIASRPSRGRLPCAARPRVSTSIQANPLWPIADLQVGRFGHDRARRPSTRARARRRRCSRTPRRRPRRRSAGPREAALGRDPRRVDHRRDAAFHVLRRRGRRAGRRASSGVKGASMPSTPTVSMWPQNISDGPGARPSSTPITFGRPARPPG